MNINVIDYTGEFAENKDTAAKLREEHIRGAISQGEAVTIDFAGVELSTQSFLHALISDVVRKQGEDVLDMIIFKNCSPLLKELIETVVQYSLESAE